MIKKLFSAFAALLCSIAVFAQDYTGGIKGIIVNREGRQPIAQADVRILKDGGEIMTVKSQNDGTFFVENLENGMYNIEVSAEGYLISHINAVVEKGYVKDMRYLSVVADHQISEFEQIKNSGFDSDESNTAEFDFDEMGQNDSPSLIVSSYDIYSNITGFGFSSVRFKNRGYANESQDVYFSGVKMNDAVTGYGPFSLWSGLNEATRAKEVSIGNDASEYAVGGYNGVTNIFGDPLNMRPGLRLSVLSNSALYRLRFMASYASGQLDNGWSIAANVSARLGGNDWVKGVYYKSFAYYLGVQKAFNDQHKLALMVFATPGQRGAQNASTQEVYDLMGDNMYNSNWGWQDGKIRNSRVRKTHEPIIVLKYTANPNDNLEFNTTLLYRTGKNGYTALDWYDAPDPRPDYYRNLPSYFRIDGKENEAKAAWAEEMWNPAIKDYEDYRHVNWTKLYNTNYNSVDGRAKYVIEERRVDQNDINLNFDFRYRINDWMNVFGGVSGRYDIAKNYKILDDLLGGKYYLNIDQFAERDFGGKPEKIQNDLDYYNEHGHAQVLKEGDKYGYNYTAHVAEAKAWANYVYSRNAWDASAALELGYSGFWRFGNYRKGLFPENSYGKSQMSNFFTSKLKLMGSYTFQGGHRLYAHFGFYNDAPKFAKSFVSPRTRNSLIPNLKTSKTLSADINYHWSNNDFDIRATLFCTQIYNQTSLRSFYDDTQHSFTNFAMTGMDERHVGFELGFKVPLGVKGLSLQGAISAGEYVYTSNPRVIQTIDNSEEVVIDNEILPYWKSHPVYKKFNDHGETIYDVDLDGNYIVEKYQKHYVPSTPQIATSLGLNYRTNSYWFFDLNGQFFANSYLDMNPLYRTDMAVAGPDQVITPTEMEYMAAQEKFKPVFLLNASVGKSWYIKWRYQIGFSLSLNNLTNHRAVKTGGYEQTRLQKTSDATRYLKFDPKYFYMGGTNYMFNLYFKF